MMNITQRGPLLLLLILLLVGVPSLISAQTGNRLARLQEEAREYLRSLQIQMESLAERIESEQPEDSSRLRNARERIVRDLLEDDMRSITVALESEDYIVALDTVRKVRSNLELVLAILEDRNIDPEQVESRLEQVAQRLKQIGEIADAQRSLRDRTATAETAQQDVQDLRDVSQAIDDIAADQQELLGSEDSTNDQAEMGQAQQISDEARRVADDLSREARRQQGIEALARRVDQIRKEVRQDSQESETLGSEQNSETSAAMQRLARRAGEQSAQIRQALQSVDALRREAAADADEGDDNAAASLEALNRAGEELERSERAANGIASPDDANPKDASTLRAEQGEALDQASMALREAADSDGERTEAIQQRLAQLRERLDRWRQEQQNQALKDYFSKMKTEAKIHVIRK